MYGATAARRVANADIAVNRNIGDLKRIVPAILIEHSVIRSRGADHETGSRRLWNGKGSNKDFQDEYYHF